MHEPVHSASGLKTRLRAAIQAFSPALWQALASVRDRLAGRHAQVAAELRSALQKLEAQQQHALQKLESEHQNTRQKFEAQQQHAQHRIMHLEQVLADYGRVDQIRTFMNWIDHAPVRDGPLVSVVLPTRDRRDRLERAIASVTAQSYANWELVIVDDGSVDSTPELLAQISDARIHSHRAAGQGVCAARNVALANLTGDIVAYLDDDNIMHRHWLKSVVWAFAEYSDKAVLYGAFVVDDPARIDPRDKGELPRMFFFAYDHHRVAVHNIADVGCIAHRARLPEARFDESLLEMGDWDLFLRLTRETPPFALPAIACYYMTDSPNRLSFGPTHEADLEKVREKNRR